MLVRRARIHLLCDVVSNFQGNIENNLFFVFRVMETNSLVLWKAEMASLIKDHSEL